MSMNHLCGCAGVSASKLELPTQREISNSCKICGGKPLVDGQGALPAIMLGNIGLEISGIIDPHLNWRTASKGKPRAVRRARTSFTSTIKRGPMEKTAEKTEVLSNKETNKPREMPVSESEKLGVTILGQRFSGTIESVPIKKRRFLFRSPSPPSHPPFLRDESGHRSVRRGIAPGSNIREHPLKINTTCRTLLEDRSVADEMANLDCIEERLRDTADFSGISILAAAACNSSSVDDVMNTESLYSRQFSSKGDGSFGISESQSGSGNKVSVEKIPDDLPILDDKMNTPLVSMSKLPCREEDAAKMGGSRLQEDSSNSSSTVLNKDNGRLGGTGSLRDDRFHWDLNTVMEAWESPGDDGTAGSQPVASDCVGGDDIHVGGVDKQKPSEGKIVEGSSKSVEEVMDNTVDLGRLLSCNYKSENLEGSNSPCHGPVADHDNGSVQEPLLGCAAVQTLDLVEETNVLNNQGPSGFTKDVEPSLLEHASDPVSNSPSGNEEDKTDTNGLSVHSADETETRAKLHLHGNASPENLMCEPEPKSAVEKTSNETVSSEMAFIGSEVNQCSDDCGSAGVQLSGAMQAGEAVFSHANHEASKVNDCFVGPVDEQVSDILVDKNLKVAIDDESHGDVGQTKPFVEEKSDIIYQLTEAGSGTCSCGLSHHEENSGGCMTKGEHVNSEKPGLQGKGALLTDQDADCIESDQHIHNVSRDSLTQDIIYGCPPTDAATAINKGYKGNLVNSPVENALDDDFECDYYSDASQNEQAIRMEEVEQQGDDESQYEDGEFRESFVHSWEMEGCDEGEAEHVDYGSDNREIDGFEAPSDYTASSIPSHIECQDEGQLEDGHAEEDHNVGGVKAEPRNFSLSAANVSSIGTTKRTASLMKKGPSISLSRRKHVCKKGDKSSKDAMESGASTEKVVEDMELVAEGDSTRERSHSASLRTKSSGWDRLPGSHRRSGDAVVDSRVDTSDRRCDSVPEKLKATVGLPLKRELPSQIGRPKSPDIVHRRGRAYFRGTRNRDHSDDIRNDVKRDIELSRSVRRDDSSVPVHCRGRGDRWMESSSHQVPSHRDSPGYYGRAGFTQTGSKNAAAVSIAKVESNGFVVAPDGTVLEASGVGHPVCLPRRSANSSPNAHRTLRRRGSPIERDETLSFNESQLDLGPRRNLSPGRHVNIGHGRPGRYRAKMVSEGNMERFHGFTPDDSIGSSMPVHHSFSRRDRSFSPQTRPVQVSRSRTRSRSQSRTRSPHVWTSPRRNNLMNNGLRHRTRSPPDFRSEARVGRVRSPHGRSSFAEHVTNFAPSPRNRASPSHASRWIDERKDITENFRDNVYRRFSGRSPPKRLFSRSHRFNQVDSPGRLKPDEFYRPVHSGRFTEFSVGRGPRSDNSNGARRNVDQYEMLPSARQYDILGDVKQLQYETEESFRLHNDHTKSAPDFPGRRSPRSFERGVSRQLNNNSPPRAKEEMGHFRYGRDGKRKTRYKAFEIRECDEDGTPRRRRHS